MTILFFQFDIEHYITLHYITFKQADKTFLKYLFSVFYLFLFFTMWSKKVIKNGFQSSHPRDGCNVVDLLLVVADGVLLLADRHEEGRHLGLVGRQRVVVLLDLGFQVVKHHRLGVQVLPDLTGL